MNKVVLLSLCFSAVIFLFFFGILHDNAYKFSFPNFSVALDNDNSTFANNRNVSILPKPASTTPYENLVWTLVDNRRVILKSAYVDSGQFANEVKILVNKHCRENRKVKCGFYSKFFQNYETAAATYDNINTADERDCEKDGYEAHFIRCRLPPLPGSLALYRPTSVFVYASDGEPRPNSIPKLGLTYVPKSRFQLAICVSPMFEWRDNFGLVLFLEYYMHQGADHFLIYNYSSGASVASVLNEYARLGLVTVIQWTRMPKPDSSSQDPDLSSHYHGQILSMNDCLWRLRTRARYAAMIDLDEFILPMPHGDSTVLDILIKNDQASIGGFMFMNSFVFVGDWPTESNSLNLSRLPQTFDFSRLTVFRESQIMPPGVRSKMIVKPTAIEKQTVHQVWKYAKGYNRFEMPSTTALMYHLRPLKAKEGIKVKEDKLFRDQLQKIFRFGKANESNLRAAFNL